jgi:hypothetical protein
LRLHIGFDEFRFGFVRKKKEEERMTTREHHYAKIRETLTDALAKIEADEDDENVNGSGSNNNGDEEEEEEEEGQTHSSSWRIPTPFVEMQDKFPEQMYPEVRIERTIGGGILGNKIANNNNNNNNNNNSEVILVESSTNSFRLSVKLKHSDELDAILTKQLSRFMHQRAEQFSIVRKKAISDEFDLSFLVTAKHKKQFVNSSLVGFMVDFLKSVDGEISEQKLSVSSRGRAVAEEFLGGF